MFVLEPEKMGPPIVGAYGYVDSYQQMIFDHHNNVIKGIGLDSLRKHRLYFDLRDETFRSYQQDHEISLLRKEIEASNQDRKVKEEAESEDLKNLIASFYYR